MALPVLTETSASSTKSSRSPTSVDLLIARSRQLRQENNSSLQRDDLLASLTQVEDPAAADDDSLVSFMRHEQELCRDSLSTRGSSESAGGQSLQSAFSAHKARLAKKAAAAEPPKKAAEAGLVRSDSVEAMQRTLASWKAERLQRNVAAKSASGGSTTASSASSSSGGSAEGVNGSGPAAKTRQDRARGEEEAVARTRRLWQQLEEVKARTREQRVREEREKNRARGREFSERMRVQRQARRDKAKPPAAPLTR